MDENVGFVDRIARLLIGVVIVVGVLAPFAGMIDVGGWGTLWLLGLVPLGVFLGLLLLLTGATGRSFVYRWAGVDTTAEVSANSEASSGTEASASTDEATEGSTR